MPGFRVVSFEGYGNLSHKGHLIRNWLIVDERDRTVISYPTYQVGRWRAKDERARLMALGRCAELNTRARDAA